MGPEIDPRRSALMSRIRSSNTRSEIALRMLLHALGYRFRLHRRDLPGKPDVVLPRHRLVLFVHGCFWHQHPGCRLAQEALTALGWRVEVIWECDARKPAALERRVLEALKPKVLGHES